MAISYSLSLYHRLARWRLHCSWGQILRLRKKNAKDARRKGEERGGEGRSGQTFILVAELTSQVLLSFLPRWWRGFLSSSSYSSTKLGLWSTKKGEKKKNEEKHQFSAPLFFLSQHNFFLVLLFLSFYSLSFLSFLSLPLLFCKWLSGLNGARKRKVLSRKGGGGVRGEGRPQDRLVGVLCR